MLFYIYVRIAFLWRDGRVVECAGLEIRYTVILYRGFKSHSLRHPPPLNSLLIVNR